MSSGLSSKQLYNGAADGQKSCEHRGGIIRQGHLSRVCSTCDLMHLVLPAGPVLPQGCQELPVQGLQDASSEDYAGCECKSYAAMVDSWGRRSHAPGSSTSMDAIPTWWQHCQCRQFVSEHVSGLSSMSCSNSGPSEQQLMAMVSLHPVDDVNVIAALQAAWDMRADPQLWASCKDDSDNLCKGIKPGGGRLQACLVSTAQHTSRQVCHRLH